MSDKTIKSALGLLQDDPDHSGAWDDLRQLLSRPSETNDGELAKEAAKASHRATYGRSASRA